MRTNQIVAGALYDFVGMLTTLPQPITVWAGAETPPVLDKMHEWAADRGLDLDQADVNGWSKSMRDPQVDPFVSKLSEADHRRINAGIRDELTRVMLRADGRVRESYPVERGTVRHEYTEGNPYNTFGVHDLVIELCKRLGIVPEQHLDKIVEFELVISQRLGTQLAVTYYDTDALPKPEEVFQEFELLARHIKTERQQIGSERPAAGSTNEQ